VIYVSTVNKVEVDDEMCKTVKEKVLQFREAERERLAQELAEKEAAALNGQPEDVDQPQDDS
jgi:hypothetical protein